MPNLADNEGGAQYHRQQYATGDSRQSQNESLENLNSKTFYACHNLPKPAEPTPLKNTGAQHGEEHHATIRFCRDGDR